jgi:hypothetical protein
MPDGGLEPSKEHFKYLKNYQNCRVKSCKKKELRAFISPLSMDSTFLKISHVLLFCDARACSADSRWQPL